MTLGFLNIGPAELAILLIAFGFIIAIGHYGKNTALGYTGSVLLSILTTPFVAFIIISILRSKNSSVNSK